VDVDGRQWAANPDMEGQLQLLHTIASGDSLSKLAGQYLANGGRWTEIRNVPQNRALQGPDANTGLFPGDVVLIPNLVAPTLPASAAQPTPTVFSPATVPSVLSAVSPGQPTALPSPAGTSLPGGAVLVSDQPGLQGGTPVTTIDELTIEGEVPFWTPPKVAMAAIVGTGAVFGVLYLVNKRS